MSESGIFRNLFRSSAISGILAAWASLPFVNADGTFPYKNIFDAMGKVHKYDYIDYRQLRST
jgi:hypothetical protein